MHVEAERITQLIDEPPRDDGRFVLYWMQASQRAEQNPALEVAIERANEHRLPLVVVAIVMPDYPGTSLRHSAFMLGGCVRALRAVERRGARPCLRVGEPIEVVTELAQNAAEIVVDRGYLRHQQGWYSSLAERLDRRVTQVEGDVVVPVALVTDKHEHAARTIRPKVQRHLDDFLVALPTTPLDVTDVVPHGTTSDLSIELDDDAVISTLLELGVDDSVAPVDWLTPGTPGARSRLADFVADRSAGAPYAESRNRYADRWSTSVMSPYLHFGQISPVAVALGVRDELDDADEYVEELVVRRELAVNHVVHDPDYDRWESLPDWARATLDAHANDAREGELSSEQLEAGETDDTVWNAVMAEIRTRGWVHNQLRMYWGKQILDWVGSPRAAFETLRDLNDRWFLDGRDPSSYANVGWCFGLHDQGFQEREVIGKLRPFTVAALKRKDDLRGWLADAERPGA